MTQQNRRQSGFTLVELLVVIGIIALLISILLPALNAAKERANRVKCQSNLSQVGKGLLLYSNDNKDIYPRTYFQPNSAMNIANTGSTAIDPFAGATGAVGTNNVPASMFLLIRNELSPAVFICPSSNAEADTLGGQPATRRSNFQDIKQNLSYSFACPFPNDNAVKNGYKWRASGNPDFAIAADRNDGTISTSADSNSSSSVLKPMNSKNHDSEGQNVLYNDGHVEWSQTPFCGANKDCIYGPDAFTDAANDVRNNPAKASGTPSTSTFPNGATDSVLLPALNAGF